MLMAHEAHRNMREHYSYDKRKPGEQVEKPKLMLPHEMMRKRFFGS